MRTTTTGKRHGEELLRLYAGERTERTLYIGVTSNLIKRVWEHKEKVVEGFTKHHGVDKLVWFEGVPDAEAAIRREKQMKEWKPQWKLELIEKSNPYWRDLYDDITQ